MILDPQQGEALSAHWCRLPCSLFLKCCGTVTISCGSGFDLSKVAVPVPVLYPDNYKHSFSITNFFTKSCFFSVRRSNASQKFGLSFLIFDLCISFYFMLDPDSNSVPDPEANSEPECISILVPLRQKVAVPISQRCFVRYLRNFWRTSTLVTVCLTFIQTSISGTIPKAPQPLVG